MVNLILLGLFAVQHSVMARPWFKRWWTRSIPKAAERSTYVLLASLVLGLLLWQWRPMPAVIWEVEFYPARILLWVLFWLGWATAVLSTFMIDHFHLFGLSQLYQNFCGRQSRGPAFRVRWLYKYVRHPIMSGFIIAFWATPTMTVGHLLFALATTAYIVLGLIFEERDLVAAFPGTYEDYQKRVPRLIPRRPRT